MTTVTTYDASAQALGYLHQIRSALLLAVQKDTSSDVLSLEIIDDVAFDGKASGNGSEVFQYKHSLTKVAKLTDKSVDLWKTLRVWSSQIHAGRLDPEHTVFSLVTTGTAVTGSALVLLRRDKRLPEIARQRIESAGAESSNRTVKSCFEALDKLKVTSRKLLFRNMFLLDGSPDIATSRKHIERELRYAVNEPQRELSSFADRLEGWWFRTAIEHLSDESSLGIEVSLVHQKIRELADQFKRDNLPDDLLDALVPSGELKLEDERKFVTELRRITANRHLIRLAQDDHYRAFEQRSRWVRETLLGINEESAYERRLLREWAGKASIAMDGWEILSEPEKIALGMSLYKWVQDASASSPVFFIRSRFASSYLPRGSFHMLVDKERLVWHPDDAARFLDKFLEPSEDA